MPQVVQQSQKSLWESFQRLLGVEQPQVAPIGQTPQQQGAVNPFAPEFLEGLKKFGSNMNKVQETPYKVPEQNAYGQGFGGGGAQLPGDSYAAAIQNFVQSYKR
jgi:hypothetical protein